MDAKISALSKNLKLILECMKYDVNFCLYPTAISLSFSPFVKHLLYILGNLFLCTYVHK